MTNQTSRFHQPTHSRLYLSFGPLSLAMLLAFGLLGCETKTEPGITPATGQTLASGAQTFKISRQAEANLLSWQGTVQSRLAVKIAPKLNARIIEVLVNPGDKLKKGEVIARLDDRDLRAAYNAANAAQLAAQAQAAQANAEEKRIIDLYHKQAATRQNYDAVLAQAQAARAMANQAASSSQQSQVMLGENVLYAPFDGVVDERLQEPGDMGMPNQAIISFHKADDLRLEAAIASHCAANVKLGMAVNVKIDTLLSPISGVVDEIAPEVDPQTRTQLIKVKLQTSDGLKHGQFGWLELACQAQQQTLLIPATALIHYGQLQAVKVVEGQLIHVRHVRTGKRYGEKLEVLSGLHEGETILSNGGL